MMSIIKMLFVVFMILCGTFLFDKIINTCNNEIKSKTDAINFSINHWNKLIDSERLYRKDKDLIRFIIKSRNFNDHNSSLRTQESSEVIFNTIWTVIYKTKYNEKNYEIITQFDKCGINTDETQALISE